MKEEMGEVSIEVTPPVTPEEISRSPVAPEGIVRKIALRAMLPIG